MRISTGQMAKIMMQTLQGAKDAGGQLELKVGTVVRATLMEFLSNNKSEAWLMIGNTKVRAQVEAHLQPGDQLDLLVTGEQMRGALELKLVGQPMRGDAGKAMQMDLASILNALQVPEGDEMKAMVQEFVSRSLPLNPDILKQAGQVLKSLGSAPTPAQVATLGKMAELGIPINPSTFQAMDALDNGPKLHQLLTSVAASLDNILTDGEKSGAPATAVSSGQTEASKGASSPASGQTQGTGTTTQTATSATESNTPKPAPQVVSNASSAQATDATADAEAKPTAFQAPTSASASPDVAEQPPTSTTERTQEQTSSPAASAKTEPPATHSGPERTQSAFPENKNSRPLPTQADGNAVDDKLSPRESARDSLKQLAKVVHDLAKDANTSADSLRDKAKQLGLAFEERLGAALRRLPADSDASAVRDAVQNALNSFTTEQQGSSLKEALLNVQRSAAELTAAGHGALADDVSTLLNNLTGQQLMSTPGQTQQRSDLFYQFSAVPLQMNGREQTVELHVMSRKGPGQKSLDPSNCYVLFRLDMPNLGPLDIHLHIVDRVVGVRFVSEDKETVQIEAAEQRDLRDKLQGVGYHLGVLKVEEKQPLQEGQQLPLLPPLLTQSSLDLRM